MPDAVLAGSRRLSLHGHLPGLDVLRGLAVVAVVFFHGFDNAGFIVPPAGVTAVLIRLINVGKLGVYLFFVLSGFLITSILLKQRERPSYYRNFYVRRALRILPAYLLMLLVLILSRLVHWQFVAACLLFTANMAKLLGSSPSEYGVFWSLAVEEQFYLIWPTFVQKLRNPTNLLTAILIGCAVAPLLRIVLTLRGIGTYLLAPTNMDSLLYGALCAVLIHDELIHTGNIRRVYRMLLLFGTLLLPPYILLYCFSPAHSPTFWALWDAFGRLVPFCFFVAGILFSVAQAQTPARGNASVAVRSLTFTGYVSYGLYLVHPLIFTAYDKVCAGTKLGVFQTDGRLLVVRFLAGAGTSMVIAWISRRYFEQLFLERKRRLAPYSGERGEQTEVLP